MTGRGDRAALEWALALTDRVVALTVGPPASGEVLDWAARPGRDGGGPRVWDAALGELDLSAMTRVVAAAVRRIAPDIVVAGERGLAGATGALPALVAARLGWPSVDGAIRLGREERELVAERRLSGGRREELAVPCPAVVTVTADSAEPRYVSVQARRAATRRGHADVVSRGPPASRRRRCGPRSGSGWSAWTGPDRDRAGPPPRRRPDRPPSACASSWGVDGHERRGGARVPPRRG